MTLEKIKEMLTEKLDAGVDADGITEDSKFSELGLDSLDMAEILMNVETVFGVSVETDENIDTVGALIKKIESLRG